MTNPIKPMEKEAQHIIQQHESVHLSNYDWDIFLKASADPPQPNENLKKAFARYKKLFANACEYTRARSPLLSSLKLRKSFITTSSFKIQLYLMSSKNTL